ncbi:peptide-aspartate beta-dioxygenase [Aureococcus anophagefferens]|nr:peptide-aspartate beta-dioxygenase [Aureococcus anophagefferens]
MASDVPLLATGQSKRPKARKVLVTFEHGPKPLRITLRKEMTVAALWPLVSQARDGVDAASYILTGGAAVLLPDDGVLALWSRARDVAGPGAPERRLREAAALWDEVAARCAPKSPGASCRAFLDAHLELQSLFDRLRDVDGCRARGFAVAAAPGTPFWRDGRQRPPHFLPHLEAAPWHDARRFPWTAVLESHADVVRAELDHFVSSPAAGRAFGNVSRRDQDLAGGADRWRQCQLLDGRACPRTTATLRRIPEVADCADCGVGQMIFSCLAPGAKLRPHCGPTNARLTVHMGLIVPPGGSRITVGGEREWREGASSTTPSTSDALPPPYDALSPKSRAANPRPRTVSYGQEEGFMAQWALDVDAAYAASGVPNLVLFEPVQHFLMDLAPTLVPVLATTCKRSREFYAARVAEGRAFDGYDDARYAAWAPLARYAGRPTARRSSASCRASSTPRSP